LLREGEPKKAGKERDLSVRRNDPVGSSKGRVGADLEDRSGGQNLEGKLEGRIWRADLESRYGGKTGRQFWRADLEGRSGGQM
ncbi:hypothetical protein Dimus_026080, partial [Dionaea muscipula]